MEFAVPPLKTYRHYKGDLYEVIACGEHADTNMPMIAYRKANELNPVSWFHDADDFFAEVEWEGKKVKRFTPVTAGS